MKPGKAPGAKNPQEDRRGMCFMSQTETDHEELAMLSIANCVPCRSGGMAAAAIDAISGPSINAKTAIAHEVFDMPCEQAWDRVRIDCAARAGRRGLCSPLLLERAHEK